MKINTSYVIAGGLFLAIGLWFGLNNLGEEVAPSGSTAADAIESSRKALPTVQVRTISAVPHDDILALYGQTQAAREVAIKAETAGRVAQTPIREGSVVRKGTVVCRLDVDARQARVDQAKANLRTVETDLNAARVLTEKGFQSATRVTAFEAQRDGALASLKQAEIELDNVNMRAPFTGMWEKQMAELGDYLAPGQACGLLVDLSPLEVSVQLTETQVGLISAGDTADIILNTGQSVTGEVAFIEAKADPATRTFRTELRVPNDDFKLKAGVTATVRLSAGETTASKIPTNIMTLNDAGDVGVRYLDDNDIVRFVQVRTIDEDADGAWVIGLPDRARVITTGQDYVAIGQQVAPDATYGRTTGSDLSSASIGN